MDTQNIGEVGSVIFMPSNVAAAMLGSVPRKLPKRHV